MCGVPVSRLAGLQLGEPSLDLDEPGLDSAACACRAVPPVGIAAVRGANLGLFRRDTACDEFGDFVGLVGLVTGELRIDAVLLRDEVCAQSQDLRDGA